MTEPLFPVVPNPLGATAEEHLGFAIPEWAYAPKPTAEPTRCRSCKASILWVETVKRGRPAPINRDGTSHFATCPQADGWRRR